MRAPLFPTPSDWVNLPTKPVRVPEILLPQILEYSHQLDQRIPPQPLVLGIKPSISSTGWGLITDSELLIDYGTIETNSDDPISERLKEIYNDLSEILSEFRPRTVIVEQVYLNEDYPTTAIKTLQTMGTILAASAQFEIVPKIVYAMQWKSQLDFARMSQDEVCDTICALFDLDLACYHHGLSGLGIALGGKDL